MPIGHNAYGPLQVLVHHWRQSLRCLPIGIALLLARLVATTPTTSGDPIVAKGGSRRIARSRLWSTKHSRRVRNLGAHTVGGSQQGLSHLRRLSCSSCSSLRCRRSGC